MPPVGHMAMPHRARPRTPSTARTPSGTQRRLCTLYFLLTIISFLFFLGLVYDYGGKTSRNGAARKCPYQKCPIRTGHGPSCADPSTRRAHLWRAKPGTSRDLTCPSRLRVRMATHARVIVTSMRAVAPHAVPCHSSGRHRPGHRGRSFFWLRTGCTVCTCQL